MGQKTCGVYTITHIDSGRYYIGISVQIEIRFAQHLQQLRNNNNSTYLQNAWNKYGEEAFVFEIVKICSREEAVIEEQRILSDDVEWVKTYNISRESSCGADLRAGWSDERREEFSRTLSQSKSNISEVTREKLRQRQLGRKYSDESRKKMSESGRHRPPISDETREKLRNRPQTGRKQTPEIIARRVETRRQNRLKKMALESLSESPQSEED